MKEKKVIAIIPARMASSRFPGKPLVKILGLPMIEHVRRRAILSSADDVYVATCDKEIFDVVVQYGGKAVMTSNTHLDCTDRVEEAARNLHGDIIVMIQGDEPLFIPEVLDSITAPLLHDTHVRCTNLLSVITEEADFSNSDVVKTVLDYQQYVMCYSRSPIPYRRVRNDYPLYRQTGIAAFTKEFLSQYSKLSPTPNEITECVGFLRILENRYPILGVIYHDRTVGVDRPDDVSTVEKIIQEDPVQKELYNRILSL
ncbi:MAG: 3-deoxy-manno-octulosonate cytidylyltransferase [bacterium]|nr:3-deoxy-manno-octulosonate cytidylyltransferase [bacterium]